MKHHNPSQSGFALLMTLVVVGVVISVGLSILDLSVKQVRLATNARDSEIAFHAANAGMECAQYWRRKEALNMEVGNPIGVACFGTGPSENTVGDIKAADVSGSVTGDGEAFQYNLKFTWGSPARCSALNIVVATADEGGSGMIINDMTAVVPGYPNGTTKTCAAGARCTVTSVRGYNRSCDTISTFGTIEREVLLQY